MTAERLEEALASFLHFPDDESSPDDDDDDDEWGGGEDPVRLLVSEDGYLLKCRRPEPLPMPGTSSNEEGVSMYTVTGVLENAGLYPRSGDSAAVAFGDVKVGVSFYRPRTATMATTLDDGADGASAGCRCVHPRGDWGSRRRDHGKEPSPGDADTSCQNGSAKYENGGGEAREQQEQMASIRIVDLTELQRLRRRTAPRGDGAEADAVGELAMTWDSSGSVCHLLRSVLTCPSSNDSSGGAGRVSFHCASPWSSRYLQNNSPRCVDNCSAESESECRRSDQVVAILLRGHCHPPSSAASDDAANDDDVIWDEIERAELSEMIKFRTGDASPSYYLHSVSRLALPTVRDGGGSAASLESALARGPRGGAAQDQDGGVGNRIEEAATLLVYRHLSPRDHLTVSHPLGGSDELANIAVAGPTVADNGNSHDPYILWDAYQPPKPDNDGDLAAVNGHDEIQPTIHYRRVAPPYQSHEELYPGLLDEILAPENLRAITDEALQIPQWTAWPEKNHYSSSADGEDNEEAAIDRENSPYPATWTVFPLCHTFPATDVANRQWIVKTCGFVPRTTELLRGLGPVLRTALFSRLEPRTTLSAHTGWSDLANHVLRVHVPLVVPGGAENDGLCGTWVDGCVETHEAGRIVCFDDSKVHRAFNYTDGERIVLIVDLERPAGLLPEGTATGGHTEELDKFIKELT